MTLHLGNNTKTQHAIKLSPNVLTQHMAVMGMTGSGKCLGPDVPVLMFDGSIKRAADIRIGDQLMGPDSKPRTAHSTVSSRGEMFKIVPVVGDSWTCNDVHILTLVHTETNEVIDLPLNEYLAKSASFKHRWKQFFTSVDFPQVQECPVDPYFLGVWFGDGTKKTNGLGLAGISISKPDPEIFELCKETANKWGLNVTVDNSGSCPTFSIVGDTTNRGKPNPLTNVMRELLGSNLCVPSCIQYGSKETRMAFLAGFLDSDGYLSNGVFDLVQKRHDYIDSVSFIARSLGIRATTSLKVVDGTEYKRVCLSGDFTQLPMRIPRKIASVRNQVKDVTRTGFTVEALGEGDYAGFTLDGDGRFLLGDFTVTHNTGLILGMVEDLIENNVPAIVVDIKGDMANIALESPLKDKMALRIFTPGASHGESVNMFANMADPDRYQNATTTILKMIKEKDYDLISAKHVYISKILCNNYASQKNATLETLIEDIMEPPFMNVGKMDVDSVMPGRTRTALATKINNMIASPSFAEWYTGSEIDVEEMFKKRKDGRTNVTVFSVAHITNEDQRMMALSLLFDQVLGWMRKQQGADGLRAALIVDECVGLLPPYPANPPTKAALMTLLKQARAFGLGLVLSSQNPMDVDYKSMSNCATWLIGRLQMKNDRERVLDAVTSTQAYSRTVLNDRITRLTARQFMLVRVNAFEDITTKNVKCKLKGPLHPREISKILKEYSDVDDYEDCIN